MSNKNQEAHCLHLSNCFEPGKVCYEMPTHWPSNSSSMHLLIPFSASNDWSSHTRSSSPAVISRVDLNMIWSCSVRLASMFCSSWQRAGFTRCIQLTSPCEVLCSATASLQYLAWTKTGKGWYWNFHNVNSSRRDRLSQNWIRAWTELCNYDGNFRNGGDEKPGGLVRQRKGIQL